MPSWNQRFFIPSLLLTCIVLSGAVLAQPQPKLIEPGEPEFLPEIGERGGRVGVVEQIEPTTEVEITETDVETTPQEPATTTQTEVAATPTVEETTTSATTVSAPEVVTPVVEVIEEPEPTQISVKLTIQGPGISKSGNINVEAGSSVYQVLKKASQQLDFSFKTSHHGSLGIFVEGIAGVTNNPKINTYWLYYVNGQFASRGVSLQTVQEGDTITWSYE